MECDSLVPSSTRKPKIVTTAGTEMVDEGCKVATLRRKIGKMGNLGKKYTGSCRWFIRTCLVCRAKSDSEYRFTVQFHDERRRRVSLAMSKEQLHRLIDQLPPKIAKYRKKRGESENGKFVGFDVSLVTEQMPD